MWLSVACRHATEMGENIYIIQELFPIYITKASRTTMQTSNMATEENEQKQNNIENKINTTKQCVKGGKAAFISVHQVCWIFHPHSPFMPPLVQGPCFHSEIISQSFYRVNLLDIQPLAWTWRVTFLPGYCYGLFTRQGLYYERIQTLLLNMPVNVSSHPGRRDILA